MPGTEKYYEVVRNNGEVTRFHESAFCDLRGTEFDCVICNYQKERGSGWVFLQWPESDIKEVRELIVNIC